MVQELTIIRWCDLCPFCGRERNRTGLEYEWVMDLGEGTRALDICDDCQAAPVTVLMEAYSEAGRPFQALRRSKTLPTFAPASETPPALAQGPGPRFTRSRSSRYPCPLPGCDFSRSTPAVLNVHTVKEHDLHLDSLPPRCPICDFDTKRLLGVQNHTTKTHHMVLPNAYRWAAENGDPMGLVAALIERLGHVRQAS